MKIPRHVGIIMDGNGRWARKRNLPKFAGYRAGMKSAEIVIEEAASSGVKALTLYTFSTENWKRPRKEVDFLMSLLGENMDKGCGKLAENGLRFNCIGDLDGLSPRLREKIKYWMAKTAQNRGMVVTLAINYGSREEILEAARSLCEERCRHTVSNDAISEKDFEKHLYTKDLPELDLVIRTSGERRLSNFLLWQAAYAEFYVTSVLWPDFRPRHFMEALREFASRERRFGG